MYDGSIVPDLEILKAVMMVLLITADLERVKSALPSNGTTFTPRFKEIG
jgi:hypothetical protein